MAEATLVFRVPVELQDIIINVVDQILNVKDLLSSPPYKNSDIAFSSTGIASVASNSKENNNITLYNAANVATGKEESKEDKREIVKEKNEETKEEPRGFQPPSYEEVFSYLRERNSPVNPGRFYNWMKDHNWTDGRGDPITDWKKKVEDWERKSLELAPKQTRVQKLNSQLQSHTKEHTPQRDDTAKLYKRLVETGSVNVPTEGKC